MTSVWLLPACAAPTLSAESATSAPEQLTTLPNISSDTWDGEWSSFVIWEDGSSLDCGVTLQTTGQDVTGSLDCGDYATGTVRGTLTDDLRSISGFVDDSLGNKDVPFEWFLVPDNADQFKGNLNIYAWCGNRENASFPRPCVIP